MPPLPLLLLLLLPPAARGDCGPRPDFGFAEPDGAPNASYPVGTNLTYRCGPGYTAAAGKSPLVTCLENSSWAAEPEFCVGEQCSTPEIPNGKVVTTDLRLGETVNFSCDAGYQLTGKSSLVCVLVGSAVAWDGDVPVCRGPCGPPPRFTFAEPSVGGNESHPVGTRLKYRCRPGYAPVSGLSPFVTCLENSSWSEAPVFCEVVSCPNPEVPNGKKVSGFGPRYTYGNTVTFECDTGYALNGSHLIRCEADNAWSPPVPMCVRPLAHCGPPPRFPFAEPSAGGNESHPVGTRLRYRCRPGYAHVSGLSPFVTCLENSSWSEAPVFCEGKLCTTPEIPNGRVVVLTDTRFGATINFTCNVGFRLIGPTSATCVLAGTSVDWNKELPICDAIPCTSPPNISNGEHTNTGGDFVFGSVVTYTCNSGFSLVGNSSIHCTTKDNVNGVWSGPAPECKVVSCPNPEVQNGKKVSGFGPHYTYRDAVTFECNAGYALNGSHLIRCEADNAWSPPVPMCVRRPCGPPPRFTFAEPSAGGNESHPVGTRLEYRCRPGYAHVSGLSPFVTCLENSSWSEAPVFCEGKLCTTPEIPNGRVVVLTDTRFGATINFTCNEGFRLIGPTSATCVLAGTSVDWNKELPICDAIPCTSPPNISNGEHTNTGGDFVFGSVVTYTCNSGFSLVGNSSIHCTTKDNVNGVWSGPAPECKVVSCPNPEVQNGKKVSGFGPHYTYRDAVTFECNAGYALNGSHLIQCEADSAWSPPVPTCDLRHCGPPPRVSFAEPNGTADKSYPVGTTLAYHCCPGYAVTGGEPQTITCLATAAWSSAPKSCVGKRCTVPELQNGKIDDKGGFQLGGTASFSCNQGYSLQGPNSTKCVVSGNNVAWDQPIPTCIREPNTATTTAIGEPNTATAVATGSIPLLLALLVLNL